MVRLIEDLAGDWRRLDERIEAPSGEIEALASEDAGCEWLMSEPGIGPTIASATVAAIGTGDGFAKGRDFAARLRLVPKQISTGDRTILGKISKRGNRYLRVLFVQAAWVVLIKISFGELAVYRLAGACSAAAPCIDEPQDQLGPEDGLSYRSR
jgi:transposase